MFLCDCVKLSARTFEIAVWLYVFLFRFYMNTNHEQTLYQSMGRALCIWRGVAVGRAHLLCECHEA